MRGKLFPNLLHCRGQWKRFLGNQHVWLGCQGMPVYPVYIGSQFGGQIIQSNFEAFCRKATPGQWADQVILITDSQGSMECADFVQMGGVGAGFRGR